MNIVNRMESKNSSMMDMDFMFVDRVGKTFHG